MSVLFVFRVFPVAIFGLRAEVLSQTLVDAIQELAWTKTVPRSRLQAATLV